ncbi:hypothetical protein E1A91_A09G122200v1 [Gossypium mustelinum]|uniref:Uncharacterized protein n=1 Tax=Gossypium mustelinum TaxID=34275 RepID=A0A5D2XX62_GOSMU|nr:hypothetical protein E1A91_A09G122200v1 [Gossypium mustelinum]
MVRPLYTEENKGERTPTFSLHRFRRRKRKLRRCKPGSGVSGAGVLVADNRGDTRWLKFFFFLCVWVGLV